MEEILLIWEAAVLYTGLSLIPIFLHNYTKRFSPRFKFALTKFHLKNRNIVYYFQLQHGSK